MDQDQEVIQVIGQVNTQEPEDTSPEVVLEPGDTRDENTQDQEYPQEDAEDGSEDTASDETYDVHLYALVRVRVNGVIAMSPLEAMELAEEEANLGGMFSMLDSLVSPARDVEYAEEVLGYLLDRKGDNPNEKSRYYCRHKKVAPFGPQDCLCERKPPPVEAMQSIRQILLRLLTGRRGLLRNNREEGRR